VLAHNAAGNSPVSNTANNIPRTVPTAPRTLAAAPTNLSGQIRLTWLAPISNGGSAVTDYIVQRSPNGTTGWLTINDGVRATTGYVATGLVNGSRYYFRVLAHNAAGNSPVSNTANNIPRAVPSAPALRATAGNARVTLAWTAPTSTGGSVITRYMIQRSTNATTGWANVSTTIAATTRTYIVTGLQNGTRYYFRIAAVNAAGAGAWSTAVSAIPVAPPPPPPPPPANCSAAYPTVCIPPPPPDLDCGDIPYRRFTVLPPDPHNFDADHDGIGCESG
jgi:predicted phage tail protein